MRNLLIIFIVLPSIMFSQNSALAEAFKNGEFQKVIELSNNKILRNPDDFETHLIIAKSYNEVGEFKQAGEVLKQCERLMKLDWEKSWTLIESIKTNYGIGNVDNAKQNFLDAKKVKGTKNSEKALREIGLLIGFDELYNNWKIKVTENIIFHIDNSISDAEVEKIVTTRQKAFNEINRIFNSTLPKKIDFFVWNQKENYNTYLKCSLGFTRPNLCVSHNRINQTPGHELAHNISFWRNSENVRTKFINEGIGVCFDQQKNDKFEIAKIAYKKDPINLIDVWKKHTDLNSEILYPISGAFVEYLFKYDKAKFLALVENQTYENAEIIYGSRLANLINEFILKLNE